MRKLRENKDIVYDIVDKEKGEIYATFKYGLNFVKKYRDSFAPDHIIIKTKFTTRTFTCEIIK